MMNNIVENLQQILNRIEAACIRCNRDPKEVRLLMATKTVSAENIQLALQHGQRLIGENKLQEIKEKYEVLKNIPHESHFIGHLQSNKIKELLKFGVSCIQSLDKAELAEKLHQRLLFENKKIDVLIQLNTSAEESKFGVHPNDALELVKVVAGYSNINIKGLMTIGLFSGDDQKVRDCFKLLKSTSDKIAQQNISNVEMKELSMGMSSDLELAIEEGATIVRVGTAIFGQRIYPDSFYWNESK